LDEDTAVSSHGECRPDGFGSLLRSDRNRDDLRCFAGFFETDRLLNGNLIERVHRHLDIGEFDAGPVCLDPNFDVEVDHPLDGYKNLHPGFSRKRRANYAPHRSVSTRLPRRGQRFWPGVQSTSPTPPMLA